MRRLVRELGVQAVIEADTAGSAQLVAEWGNPADAAIASSLAAELYGLSVLRSNVEDSRDNTTRFYITALEPRRPAPDAADTVTTFVFHVRNVPAALYNAGRVCHQRCEHDEAGELHAGRRVHRDAVPV